MTRSSWSAYLPTSQISLSCTCIATALEIFGIFFATLTVFERKTVRNGERKNEFPRITRSLHIRGNCSVRLPVVPVKSVTGCLYWCEMCICIGQTRIEQTIALWLNLLRDRLPATSRNAGQRRRRRDGGNVDTMEARSRGNRFFALAKTFELLVKGTSRGFMRSH